MIMKKQRIEGWLDKIKVGMKVRVYVKGRSVVFGEVMGVNGDDKIVLAHRPDFEKLKVGEFDRFLTINEVMFLKYKATEIKACLPWIPMQ